MKKAAISGGFSSWLFLAIAVDAIAALFAFAVLTATLTVLLAVATIVATLVRRRAAH